MKPPVDYGIKLMKALSNIGEEEEKEKQYLDISYLENRHTKLTESVIESAIESFSFLAKAHFVSNIGNPSKVKSLGQNKDGLYYIVVFGLSFENASKEDKALLTKHCMRVVEVIS